MIAEQLQLLEVGSQVSGPEGGVTTPGDIPAEIDGRRDTAVGICVPGVEEVDDQLSGGEDVSPRTSKATQTALMQLLGSKWSTFLVDIDIPHHHVFMQVVLNTYYCYFVIAPSSIYL